MTVVQFVSDLTVGGEGRPITLGQHNSPQAEGIEFGFADVQCFDRDPDSTVHPSRGSENELGGCHLTGSNCYKSSPYKSITMIIFLMIPFCSMRSILVTASRNTYMHPHAYAIRNALNPASRYVV